MSRRRLLCLWVFSTLVAVFSITSDIPVIEGDSLNQLKTMHLSLFFQLTHNDRQLPDATVARAVAAAIAVYHVNERWGGIAPVLEEDFAVKCPIKFSYSFVDTDARLSVKSISNLLNELIQNHVLFVIGPNSSPVAMPASLLLEAWGLPMISPYATSSGLAHGASLFARNTICDALRARALLRYLEQNDILFAGLIFVDTEFGTSFRNDILTLSETSEVTIYPASFSRNLAEVSGNAKAIERALLRIKNRQINIVITVFPEHQLIDVMTQAYKLNMTGAGKNWIAVGEIPTQEIESLDQDKYAKVTKALNGTLHLTLAGNPLQNVNRLRDFWPKSTKYFDSIRKHMPENVTISPSFFNNTNSNRRMQDFAFAYDAVVLAAVVAFRDCERVLKMCPNDLDFRQSSRESDSIAARVKQHIRSETEHEFADNWSQWPTQVHHWSQFLYKKLFTEDAVFEGASGEVKLSGKTKSRDKSTVVFQMENVLWKTESPEDISKTVATFSTDSWKVSVSILYPPGNTSIAPNYTDFHTELNIIPSGVRGFIFSLAGVVYLLIALTFIFLCSNWNKPVMKASQPVFLLTLLVGVTIASASVFLLHPDENSLNASPDLACHLAWCLWSFGTTLVGLSLAVKLYKIYRVFKGGFEKVVIKTRNIVLVMTLCLSLNILILVLFTIFDPLTFTRVDIPTSIDDYFHYAHSSYARCKPETGSVWTFFCVCFGIYFILNVCISVIAYRTRKCPEDFQEARWIFASQFSQLLLVLLAVPTMVAVDQSSTTAQFVIASLVILFTGLITLGMIFIPKMRRLYYGPNNVSYNNAKA